MQGGGLPCQPCKLLSRCYYCSYCQIADCPFPKNLRLRLPIPNSRLPTVCLYPISMPISISSCGSNYNFALRIVHYCHSDPLPTTSAPPPTTGTAGAGRTQLAARCCCCARDVLVLVPAADLKPQLVLGNRGQFKRRVRALVRAPPPPSHSSAVGLAHHNWVGKSGYLPDFVFYTE
jgi:hypothetical protein